MIRWLAGKLSWISVGHLFNVVLGLITLKVWAAYLTPSEFGVMGLVVSTASIIMSVLAGPLMQTVLAGYVAHDRLKTGRYYRTIISRLLLKKIVLAVIFILLCGGALCWMWGLHWALPPIAAGLVAVDSRRFFEQTLLAASQRQEAYAVSTICDTGARLTGIWYGLSFWEPSAISALAGNLAGTTIFLALFLLFSELEAYPGAVVSDTHEEMRMEAVRVAKPLYPSIILSNITELSNRYIIGWTAGLDVAGLFIAAYGLVKRPYGIVNDVVAMTLTPALSASRSKGSPTEEAFMYRLWLLITMGIGMLGVLLFAVFGDLIVKMFLSAEYGSVTDILIGLAAAIAIGNVANVYRGFLLVEGRTREILSGNAAAAMTALVLTAALCPMLGLAGAVWALGAAYSIQTVFYRVIRTRDPF